MFALAAAAAAAAADVTFRIYGTRLLYVPLRHAFACHFQRIVIITCRTPFTAIFRSESE